MRVVHAVRSDAFAGVERYVCMVAPRLARRGCDVTVVGGDADSMRSHGCGSLQWHGASTTTATAAQLARLGRIDVVHAHMTAAELAAVVTKPLHRAHLVTTLHFASPRGSQRLGGAIQHLGRFMDEQLAISQYVASAAPATRVLPHGVEAAAAASCDRDRSVLVMQRLEPEKQTDVALRAWSLSGLRMEGWRLDIAGDGSTAFELRQLAFALGISDSVRWLGHVEDSAAALCSAGFLLAPTPIEGFGLAVVEAMARATPVIAADGGAHQETLGPDGLLFPPGDVNACARLLDEAAARDLAQYGAALRSRQRQLFDIERHTDDLLQVYRDLIR